MTGVPPLKSDKHLPALDGIRGLAVLAVVLFHTGGGSQSTNPLVRAVGNLVQAGWSGVTLFFVLSGFLITGILWDSQHSEHWLRNFYIRRVLRIFPLYYGTLLAVLITAFALHQGSLCLSKIWVFAAYLQNVPPFTELTSRFGSPLRLYHFWSLAVEEQFYLAWPFLLSRTRNLREAKYLCAAVFFVSFLFRFVMWTFLGGPENFGGFILTRAGELAAGGFFALCYRDESWKQIERSAPKILVISIVGFLLSALLSRSFQLRSPVAMIYGLAFITLFWASFVALSLREQGLVSRLMNLSWLRWLGTISYGVYIFHVLLIPVYQKVTSLLVPHAGRNQFLVVEAFVTTVLSFFFAWLSFRFYETPFLSLRKRFARRVGTPKTPQVAKVS